MSHYEMVLLRLLHIGTGVFWAGSIIYLAAFVLPAVQAISPEGGRFMQQLMRTRKLPVWMNIIATVNVLSGLRLIWVLSDGLQLSWMQGGYGCSLTLGAVMALIAYTIGMTVNRPAAFKIAAISQAVAKAGGPPSAEQLQAIGALRNKLEKGIRVMAWLLAAAVILMSVARYI